MPKRIRTKTPVAALEVVSGRTIAFLEKKLECLNCLSPFRFLVVKARVLPASQSVSIYF